MGVKVLWVSRHRPLEAQISELQEKLGDDVEIEILSGNIASVEEVVRVAREIGAKYIVPVLPLSMVARLAELQKSEGFTILFAKMVAIASMKDMGEAVKLVSEDPSRRNTAAYSDGTVRVFEFVGFEKLVKVELVTEPF